MVSYREKRDVLTSGKSMPVIVIEFLGLPATVGVLSGLVAAAGVAIYVIRSAL